MGKEQINMAELIAAAASEKKQREQAAQQAEQEAAASAQRKQEQEQAAKIESITSTKKWQQITECAHDPSLHSILATYFKHIEPSTEIAENEDQSENPFAPSITENLETDGFFPCPNININGIRICFESPEDEKPVFLVLDQVVVKNSDQNSQVAPEFLKFNHLKELAQALAQTAVDQKQPLARKIHH